MYYIILKFPFLYVGLSKTIKDIFKLVGKKNWSGKNRDIQIAWAIDTLTGTSLVSSARVLCWHDRVPFLSVTRPLGIDERSSVSLHHTTSSLRGNIVGEAIVLGLDTSEVPV